MPSPHGPTPPWLHSLPHDHGFSSVSESSHCHKLAASTRSEPMQVVEQGTQGVRRRGDAARVLRGRTLISPLLDAAFQMCELRAACHDQSMRSLQRA